MLLKKQAAIYGTFFNTINNLYTFYDKNLDNLIETMNKAKYELSLGFDIKQKHYSVDEWYEIWIKYKENEVKYGTVLDYCETYRLPIKQPLGQKKLKTITSDHIQGYIYELAAGLLFKIYLKKCTCRFKTVCLPMH